MKSIYVCFVIEIFLLVSAAAATKDDEKCVHEWRKFNYDREPEIDGFEVGNYKPGIRSFIGRGYYWSSKVPGRIQTTGDIGCFIVSDWKVKKPDRDVEYLVRNPRDNYVWVNSSEGEDVRDQVLVGRRVEGGFWRVGRILEDNFTFIAKVFPGGAHYESGDGREVVAQKYQILTCTPGSGDDIKDSEILVLLMILAMLLTIFAFVLGYFGYLHRHRYCKFGDVVGFQKM